MEEVREEVKKVESGEKERQGTEVECVIMAVVERSSR